MREKVFRNSSGLDLMLVLSTARLCPLNLSLRSRLVSPIYCTIDYFYCIHFNNSILFLHKQEKCNDISGGSRTGA